MSQKDRYIRQLLIADIEELTGRDLVVYFGTFELLGGEISPQDVRFLHDVLQDGKREAFDLLLQTPGGYTDATEKLVPLLRSSGRPYRALVPGASKSNGTVLALSADEIVMGCASELGPIDPAFGDTPATFIRKIADEDGLLGRSPTYHPLLVMKAEYAIKQTRKLATHALETGMMRGESRERIDETVEALSTREKFHSHGSVIDAEEARSLGLRVTSLAPDDELYRRLWLLSTLLEDDARRRGLAKIYEGSRASFELFAPTS